jgi:hypothetical protein
LPAVTFAAPRSAGFAEMFVITIRAPGKDLELSATAVLEIVIRAAVIAT